MTGVSLAGTQLRVNQYTMKDNEWNDIQVSYYQLSKFQLHTIISILNNIYTYVLLQFIGY